MKPNHVKSHLKVFVNCLVENPAFDSQTKEYMTLKQSAFGSKCAFDDKFFKSVSNCGVLESILAFAQSKQSKELKKTDGTKKQRLTGISKLEGRASETLTPTLTRTLTYALAQASRSSTTPTRRAARTATSAR